MIKSVLRTRTFYRNKRAANFHLAPLRCSLLERRIYFTLDSLQSKQWSSCGINKLFRFAFQFSVYRVYTLFYSLVCIFSLLIISEYLLKIKIFMAFIWSNALVEKLTKVLKDKRFPLTFECFILIRWISFTHFRPRQLYWDPKIVIRILD